MKPIRSALIASALLFTAGSAFAETIVISPEREVVIREYVTKHRVDPVEVPDTYTLRVGEPIPADVRMVPVDVPDSTYDYVVIKGRTAIVDRDTRSVIRILD